MSADTKQQKITESEAIKQVVDVTKDEDVKVLNVEESKDETNNMEGQDSMDKGNEVADDSKGKQRTMVLARGVFGTVEMFSRGRGYGFLKRDDGGEELFFHRSDILSTSRSPSSNFYFLDQGDKIEFDVINGPKGLRAVSISAEKGMLVPMAFNRRPFNKRNAPVGQKKVRENNGGDKDKKEDEPGSNSKGRNRANKNKASRRARDQHESKEEDMTSNGEGDPKSDEETDKDDSQELEKSV